MIKDIKSANTKKLTINGITITINFSEDRNSIAENLVGTLLVKNMFRKGEFDETSQDSVS